MPRTIPALSSNRPDPAILEALARIQKFALALIALTAGIILLAWLSDPIAHRLPGGWDGLKCNTAVLTLLAAGSISLSRPRRSTSALLASRILAWLVCATGALTFIECNSGRSFHIDALFAADRFAPTPGRMLPENAIAFVLLGFVLANVRARKNRLTPLVDVATLLLCAILLLQSAGWIMQHLHLIDLPAGHSQSTPNVLCLGLLGVLVFNRRLEYSRFAVLLGAGIAGRVARITVPIAVSIPFALDSVQAFLISHVKAPAGLLSGMGAALLSVISLCLVVILCRKIDDLENRVRELSLRDELTGLYNRRGFYFLAEQALLTARRGGESFSVCYFDLDGLKHINDTQGHDVGSALLGEMAQLMGKAFRETDILGRIGGDEFVAACKGDQPPVARLAASLSAAAQIANQQSGRSYLLSYSAGLARSEADSNEPLENLVQRADQEMYGVKRARKRTASRSR